MRPAARTVKIARVIQRAMIVLVARDVRREFRNEMIATFEAACAEAGARGSLAVWRLLFREIADLATARRANQPASVTFPSLSDAPVATRAFRHEWIQPAAWRQAWRSLNKRPAFFLGSVLTLGFGVGITTAVFSLVDTVLIKPLPFPDADRLVTVYESSPVARERTSLIAPARLEDWNRLNRSFVALSGSYSENVTDTSGNDPERLEARRVAPRFFTVYGMPPLAGRHFVEAEERPGGPGAVVISERFWTRRFHRDPAVVERALTIGGQPFQIVGVMPGGFTSAATDVWLPAQVSQFIMQIREARFYSGVGRLRPGVSIEAAARELASIQEALAKEFPKTDAGWSAELGSLKQARIGSSRQGLVLLFGSVALLWIISVANIAGLALVQVRRRSRELAIRTALGASRLRVAGAVIREGIVIALVGGTIGAGLAALLISTTPALLSSVPRLNELAVDWRALSFAGISSLLGACVFGPIPAIAGIRPDLGGVISAGGRHIAGSRHRVQKVLLLGQVALSVLLVGTATLLVRSYYDLTHSEMGFDPSNTWTFHVGARWDEDRTRVGILQEQLIANLEQLPHVQAAGFTNFLPATGATLRYQLRVDGLTGPNADGSLTVGARMISGGYLRAIRARLVAGSWCPGPTTNVNAPLAVMVNQRFVDVIAPNQNLVGRSLRLMQGPRSAWTIAGVIGNIVEDGHATTPVPYAYTCNPAGAWPDPEYVVRTSDPRAFAADLRRTVREIDPARAVFSLRTVRDVLDAALEQPRLDAAILGLFALAAVTLAGIGLYSLFMLVVSERAREMAVRLAIGAAPRELIRLVMTGAGQLLAGGVALGVALTAVSDRLLRGVFPGMSPLDAPALAAAAVTLAVVSIAAAAGPALKAARIAPIEALRTD
jgi:putative ABC transport system permease protein